MEQQPTEIFRNPKGKLDPVHYRMRTRHKDGTFTERQVRIVESGDQIFNYTAIDPETNNEVRVGALHWDIIYRTLLNMQPPHDLKHRVFQYYRFKFAAEDKNRKVA